MKFLKFIYLLLKVSGYGFFTVTNFADGIKYRRTFPDCAFFVVSFSVTLCVFLFGGTVSSSAEIQSMILLIGTSFLLKTSLLSILCTKAVNFAGRGKAFEMLKNFETIENKVCLELWMV
jgi:hypothetical protein